MMLPKEIISIIMDYKEAFEDHERWIAFLDRIFSTLLGPWLNR
jgi:hypothetical protein